MDVVQRTVSPGGRVLDVACGPGALSQRLHTMGFSVVAADAFPEVFTLHGQIPFVEMDVEKEWSGLDGQFDAIVAVEIIEHLENPYLFVRKCFNALVPGGILVLTTPNAAHYVSRIMFLLSGVFELYSPQSFSSRTKTAKGSVLPPHIHTYTGWMIRSNLERAGFGEIAFSSCTNWLNGLPPLPRRLLNLLRYLAHRFLGTMICPFMRSPAKDSIFSKNIIAYARKP
jgi:2-polyprenyl-3-methyl-5-hydroxy-6-metoxy-1,4-benzoquinol methylase